MADDRVQGSLAIERLVVEYHVSLYRYAYRLSGSAADAEDLTQQVFLIAHEKIEQMRDAAGVQAWLFTVLRNCYLRHAGRRRPVPVANLSPDFDLEKIPQEITPEEIDREQLQRAIGELPDEFKLVVLMFYFEHRSYREIATELDIPPGTVMSRLSRAKSHLRRRLFAGDEESTVTIHRPLDDAAAETNTKTPRPPLSRSL